MTNWTEETIKEHIFTDVQCRYQETDSPDKLPPFPNDDYRDAFAYATFKRDETTGEIHSTQPLEVLQPVETSTSEDPLISKYRELIRHIHDLCYYQDPNIGPTVYKMIEDFNNKHEESEWETRDGKRCGVEVSE